MHLDDLAFRATAVGVGVSAAAVLVTADASRFVADPVLAPPVILGVTLIGSFASVAGAMLSIRARDVRLGLLAVAAAALIGLPSLSAAAVSPMVEIVRIIAPLAILASTVARADRPTGRGRATRVVLAMACIGWLVGLVSPVPVPLGPLLGAEVVALWVAVALVAEPLMDRARILLVRVVRGDVRW